ncbi:YDG/SRA domain-containing protein [Streptomyces sp. NPDC019443]|uniref:YDG/SRA domain-containing protein n=1 Tax=Streptomyces sp. NPDC019443 TaxID=3365061 RepID=UPI0037977DA8
MKSEVPQARGSSVRPWLDQHNPQGGLEENLYNLIGSNETFRQEATHSLLKTYFPAVSWEEILLEVGLQEKKFDGYGHPPYIPVGAVFAGQVAAFEAKVHGQRQGGISGKQSEDAKSIVLSGGYVDDRDYGDEIIYTGQGGLTDGRHTHDQTLTRGNAALVNSIASGRPVRVLRGAGSHSEHAPPSGMRYDGLFRVEAHWQDKCAEGFVIWRFRLRKIWPEPTTAPTTTPLPVDPPPIGGNSKPERRKTEVQRIVRSTARANWVKRAHGHTCQICGLRIETPTGAYSEAAHIRPLGQPHEGPDEPDNILCLCPNHHVEFDFGMLTICSDMTVVRNSSGERTSLRTVPEHEISDVHLDYHRRHIGH